MRLDGFRILQAIRALQVRGQPVSAERITELCARARNTAGCQQATAALGNHPDSLLQARLALGVTETLYDHTDIGVRGAYSLYNQDPTSAGYFSVATAGRGEDPSLGQGVPVAPLKYTVRPSVAHRFGKLGLNLSYEYGHYVGAEGESHAVGFKASYKLSKCWRMWLAGEDRADFDPRGVTRYQLTVALGARLRL